jgi:ADP-ribosylglycohydrolase
MFGAIAGDVIGSVYEWNNVKTADFQPLFQRLSHPTDDTVLTCAVAEWLLRGAGDDLPDRLKSWFRQFAQVGFGPRFAKWAMASTRSPYDSWGNGSAMRVSPVGFAFETLEETLHYAGRSAEVTHNHPEGIKGAEATAACIFLARTGNSKEAIRQHVVERFGYNLSRTLDEIRPTYYFDVSCQGSVPEAIIAFLESTNWEDAVRKAVSLGGDSDTIACVTGGIAAAFYGGVPKRYRNDVRDRLGPSMRVILDEFLLLFPNSG